MKSFNKNGNEKNQKVVKEDKKNKIKLGNSIFKKENEKITVDKEKLKKQRSIEKKQEKEIKKQNKKIKKEKNQMSFKLFISNAINFVKKYKRILLLILLIILVIMIGIHIKNQKYNKDNEYYKEKMDIYGFSKMYDNKEATPSEKVTKSEAIKLILSTIYNSYSTNITIEEKEFENQEWVKEAEILNLITNDNITLKNASSNVKLTEVIDLLIKARIQILGIPLVTESNASFKDLGKYDSLVQSYIKDLVTEGILEDSKGNINANNAVDKGELNKILVKFAEKYKTILTNDDDMINVSKEKEPNNISRYPFTLSTVNKEVYEIPFKVWYIDSSKDPKQMYSEKKDKYAQIQNFAEEYLNTIINVDYQTINKDTLLEIFDRITTNGISESEIEKYIAFVKENNIKISGEAKAQMPTIYFDGLDYYIRVKVTFKIENSNTKENILLKDIKEATIDEITGKEIVTNNKTYTYEDENTYIVDLKMSSPPNMITLFVVPDSINN